MVARQSRPDVAALSQSAQSLGRAQGRRIGLQGFPEVAAGHVPVVCRQRQPPQRCVHLRCALSSACAFPEPRTGSIWDRRRPVLCHQLVCPSVPLWAAMHGCTPRQSVDSFPHPCTQTARQSSAPIGFGPVLLDPGLSDPVQNSPGGCPLILSMKRPKSVLVHNLPSVQPESQECHCSCLRHVRTIRGHCSLPPFQQVRWHPGTSA